MDAGWMMWRRRPETFRIVMESSQSGLSGPISATYCRDFAGGCPARCGSCSHVEEDETPLHNAGIRLLRTTGAAECRSTLNVRPRLKAQARSLLMNPNAGASLDASPLSCGLHQNVDLLQVLQRLSARLQRIDASYDRGVLTRRRDLQMLGKARRDGRCHHARRVVINGLVWLLDRGRFEWGLADSGDGDCPTHRIRQRHGSVGPRHLERGKGLQV